MENNDDGRFQLQNEQDQFKEKAGNLFSALDNVQYTPAFEKDSFLKTDPTKDNSETMSMKRQRGSESSDRRRSSLETFQMPPPCVPPAKRGRHRRPLPDHAKRPAHYTKYTLNDVSEDQMSQKSNTAAAFAFLREMDARQERDQDDEPVSLDTKIVFKKPIHACRRTDPDTKEATPAGCEADQNASSASRPAKRKKSKHTSITLSHLEYEDE